MSQQSIKQTCIVRGEFVGKGFLSIGGEKWKFISTIQIGGQKIEEETATATYNSMEFYQAFNGLIADLAAEGWIFVGKEKTALELCNQYKPQTIVLTKAADKSNEAPDNPYTMLRLLYQEGYVTDSEFLTISKRIHDSTVNG